MASVTGVTLAKMQEIANNTIVSARVVNGELLFKRGDGVTEFSVGSIIRPPIDSWPVGSIFMNTTATNPKTLLGISSSSPVTFVRWGLGRLPISLAEGNNRYNASEATGGAEFVQLDISQIPWHNHGGATGDQDRDHTHTGYAHPGGSHSHDFAQPAGNLVNGAGGGGNDLLRNNFVRPQTGVAGHHDHHVTTNGASQGHLHGISGQGGGGYHENMPPFIAVYMWKRTV